MSPKSQTEQRTISRPYPSAASTDDADAQQLVRALGRAGVEGADASTRRRTEYASDASIYRVPPLAVAFPRSADEITAAVVVCRDRDVPVTVRGAGTSVAGNAIGPGLVLDLSRHLRAIGDIDVERRSVRVEPGAILDRLQHAAAPHRLRFGPDPSTHDRCTLGGMIGNNACGSRALGFGRTVDHVHSLDLVTGQGERVRVGREPDEAGRLLTARAAAVIAGQEELVRARLGTFPRQVSGYGLHHLLPENGEDLARALVGSEGTAAIVVGATLGLVDVPPVTLLVVLGYSNMAAAADAVPGLLAHRLIALEGLDARIVDAVRRTANRVVPDFPAGAGWLFAEVPGANVAEARAAAAAVVRDAAAMGARVVEDASEIRALFRIREDGAGIVSRGLGAQTHAGWEDAAVPPTELGNYLRSFEQLLSSAGLQGVPYGHFGDGCIHVRITFPFEQPDGPARFRSFVTAAADLVVAHGGSLSGEHGDGRARSELLSRMYPPELIRTFEAFKAVFDPNDIMNPGILVRPRPVDVDIRATGTVVMLPMEGFPALEGTGFAQEVGHCVGVGRCRSEEHSAGRVMCPSFAATRDEKDSTRARAKVLHELLAGDLIAADWSAPEVEDALDLCLSCKGCKSDCPTGIDMATYKSEVLYQRYRRRLRPRSHYTLGQLPKWLRLARRSRRLAAAYGRARWARPLVARIAGMDPRRGLPVIATDSLRAWFSARAARPTGDVGGGRVRSKVVLFIDTFTDTFRPEVGRAAIRVLEDAGFQVALSPPDLCCAVTWLTTGQLDGARRILRSTIDGLDAALGSDALLVGLEPSCTAVLKDDARALLGEQDAAALRVASRTRTLAEVLASRRPDWTPPRLQGVKAVVQPHCHQHAVLGFQADENLLAACGVETTVVGGCCGLAGNFGVEKGHYEVSVAVAETQLLPAVRTAMSGFFADDVIVLTDGFSCHLQLEDLMAVRGQHLAELLDQGIALRTTSPAEPG